MYVVVHLQIDSHHNSLDSQRLNEADIGVLSQMNFSLLD